LHPKPLAQIASSTSEAAPLTPIPPIVTAFSLIGNPPQRAESVATSCSLPIGGFNERLKLHKVKPKDGNDNHEAE
jgi:hypothetical protein